MKFSVLCMASIRLRILASIILILSFPVVTSESHAASKNFDIDTYGDPDIFAAQLADYTTFSESELVDAVGNVIGHMTGMFRYYPAQIDTGWNRFDTQDLKHLQSSL